MHNIHLVSFGDRHRYRHSRRFENQMFCEICKKQYLFSFLTERQLGIISALTGLGGGMVFRFWVNIVHSKKFATWKVIAELQIFELMPGQGIRHGPSEGLWKFNIFSKPTYKNATILTADPSKMKRFWRAHPMKMQLFCHVHLWKFNFFARRTHWKLYFFEGRA